MRSALSFLIGLWWLGGLVGPAPAQDTPPVPPPVPPAADSSPVPAPAPPSATATVDAVLLERLKQLEEMNQKLLKRYEEMERVQGERYDRLAKDFQELKGRVKDEDVSPAQAIGPGGDAEVDDDEKAQGLEGTIGRGTNDPSLGGGSDGLEGGRAGPTPYARPSISGGGAPGGDTTRGGGRSRGAGGTIGRRGTEGESKPVKVTFGNGLRFDANDGEFQLQFHNLTQAELRNFPGAGGQSPNKTQFFIPRQRWYFTGRATKNIEFYTVINRGYGSLDLLDAFLNFNYDPRLQFRIGRTKTPTSYEYYQIAEGDLITPERSLFIGNLAGNRQEGAMFHGQILDKSAEYAVGVFNGPRRSFGDFNNDKDLYTFFNWRPFQESSRFRGLKYFNVGGAYNFGHENNPLQPQVFTTANDQSSITSNAVVESLSPTFFSYNNNVTEDGFRSQWSAWIAWYYKSFNILAEYDGEIQDYRAGPTAGRIGVPYEGFEVTSYYFLTGEQITRRVDIKPKKNLGFKNNRFTGLGAFEVYTRYSTLNIGKNVFSGGLADPNLWTSDAQAIDLGMNWYLNQYTKIYLDWQYSIFGTPVYNGVGALRDHANLVWLRFQLFF